MTTETKRTRLRSQYHLNDIELHRLLADTTAVTTKELRILIWMGLTAHQVASYLAKSDDPQAVEAGWILQGYIDREVDAEADKGDVE